MVFALSETGPGVDTMSVVSMFAPIIVAAFAGLALTPVVWMRIGPSWPPRVVFTLALWLTLAGMGWLGTNAWFTHACGSCKQPHRSYPDNSDVLRCGPQILRDAHPGPCSEFVLFADQGD